MLRTRSIKSEIRATDGERISVMSRHTLADGKTPDPDITAELFDKWWPELAPPAFLIGSYHKRGMSWHKFDEGYRKHLREPTVATRLSELIDLASNSIVTILCVEETPEYCHRRLLAEECLLLEPGLEIEIQ